MLANLGALLWGEEALAPSQEAADLYRELAVANPAVYLPDLAGSLRNLGSLLSELGRGEDALGPSQEAVTTLRRLAEENPVVYLPDLARSQNVLCALLAGAGRWEEALAFCHEAADLYQRLVEANRAVYLPDLAASLRNLGSLLWEAGRREEALAPSQEALAIWRHLAVAKPVVYLPDLAMSLWAFAWVRVRVGLELPEALAAVQDAILLYEPLTRQFPGRFDAVLWPTHHTLADVLDGLGRSTEAAELRRQLAELSSGEPDGDG